MPSAEVVSIGTELLLGQVLDTNSQFFALELAKLGINSFYRVTVGDNKDRIKATLLAALSRSDVVITSGGLGPTADDLTTECISEIFDAAQVEDPAVVERIKAFFALRNAKMPETNRKQAFRPLGSDILSNPVGTAPGIVWDLQPEYLAKIGLGADQHRLILTFPGVPSELRSMWQHTAEPLLSARYGKHVLWSCELKHYGIGESALAEQYGHLLDLADPTVAPYAGRGECRLRVTAKADTVDDAKKLAQPVIDEISAGSKHRLYGFDDDTLESVIGKLLTERKMTIALAESCTGGLISKRLTDVAGSSQYVALNLVTYSNEAKNQILKVDEDILKEHGAVSPQCARAMAEGLRTLTGADISVSVTGLAGPGGGSAEKPVGLVYLGLCHGSKYYPLTLRLPEHLSRDEIRFRTANEALNLVRLVLVAPDLLATE